MLDGTGPPTLGLCSSHCSASVDFDLLCVLGFDTAIDLRGEELSLLDLDLVLYATWLKLGSDVVLMLLTS